MSKFLKEHKKNLWKLTKKQLIKQILIWLEMNAHQSLGDSIRYDDLNDELTVTLEELRLTQHRLKMNEWFLKSAESVLVWKENLSIWGFIKNKYFK